MSHRAGTNIPGTVARICECLATGVGRLMSVCSATALRMVSPRGTISRLHCYSRSESDGLEMSDTYIIEVRSQAAGIVVRDREGYRFFAASHRFNPIEGQVFRNAREAERAALRIANGGLTLVA
jgi:hypothetical protein